MPYAIEQIKHNKGTITNSIIIAVPVSFISKVFYTRCGKAAKREYYRGKNGIKYRFHCRYCDGELRRTKGLKTIKPIQMEIMETVVAEMIMAQINTCLDYDGKLEKVSRSTAITHKRHNLTQERDNFIKAAKRAEDLLSAAYAHHLNGLLDSNEFEFARTKFENDKQAAAVSLERVERELSEYELDEIRKNECLTHSRAFKDFEKLVGIL